MRMLAKCSLRYDMPHARAPGRDVFCSVLELMKAAYFLILLALPTLSWADSMSCPSAASIAGNYETKVAPGYTPNRLSIARDDDRPDAWKITTEVNLGLASQ